MVDTDVSSPGYFLTTFGVGEAQAAELSRQAGLISRTGGGGITAEAPRAPPSTSAPPALSQSVPAAVPGQGPLSARAEYDQIMADRAAGKINSAQWASIYAARERALAEQIANGGGAQPAAAAAAPAAEAHPYLGAPVGGDYGLLRGAGDMPEAEVAEITQHQHAFARLNLNRSVVQDVHDRLRTFSAEAKNATPEQVSARVEANYTRFGQMLARDGISMQEAEDLIGQQVRRWSTAEPALRETLRSIVSIGDPTMLDYILQIAIHNRGGRR